jgi:hypothetical protein
VWGLIVLLVAIAVGVVWYPRRGRLGASGAASRDVAAETRATPPPAAATGVGHATEAAASQDAAAQRSTARAKRDALREQILRQLAQRPAPDGGGPSPAAAAGSSGDPVSGGLRNRLDELHQPVVDQVNRDFMPLASECIEQAQARLPQLAGMIALSMETVADEQLGGVVDVADPALSNQIGDPLLFECLRESAFSLTLPPPPVGGRMKVMITLRVDPPSGSSSGSPGSGHP